MRYFNDGKSFICEHLGQTGSNAWGKSRIRAHACQIREIACPRSIATALAPLPTRRLKTLSVNQPEVASQGEHFPAP